MLSTNLVWLRKHYQYTQEEIAQQVGVSRQSVAKWESGESLPDIDSCMALAKIYNVTIDNLINHDEDDAGIVIPPKGKHFFGTVTVVERGQIVIPQEARRIFKISAGDKILILGDEERGLAIVHQRDVINFVSELGVPKNEKD